MTTMIGFLGTQKDARGFNERRWERFRPTVASCCHPELGISHYYLIHDGNSEPLLNVTIGDMKRVNPSLIVKPVVIKFDDPFEPSEALRKQSDFVLKLRSDDYLINFTTGSVVQQIAWFELVKANYLNAKIVQVYSSGLKYDADDHQGIDNAIVKGNSRVIDLKLAKYDLFHQLTGKLAEKDESVLKQGIETRNERYNQMISLVERVAVKNNRPFLIDGPTGAGKTKLAKRIYKLKKSKNILEGSFVYINCATLRPEQAQSEIFGHIKGAFTGAASSRKGALKNADKGLLFLDEVKELPLDVQGMLLDAIESKKYKPMGSDSEVRSDFVLVCGTNVDLYQEVRKGNFRDDLLARINLWHFTLPGLKERPEDISSNIDYELAQYKKNYGIVLRFNKEAREKFLSFATSPSSDWSHNFRDLAAAIERMGTLSDAGVINEDVVASEIRRLKVSWNAIGGKGSDVDWASEILGNKALSINMMEKMKFNLVVKICQESERATHAASKLYGTDDGNAPKNPASALTKYLEKSSLTFEQLKSYV